MSKNMFDRLARAGNVKILGDPALQVEEANVQSMVKYTDQGYNIAEEVNMGMGGRQAIAAAPDALNGTLAALQAPNTSLPYMVQRITIPSSVSLYFMISLIKIAAIDLKDGFDICGDIFSEVSLNNGVRFPTAQTGQQIQMSLTNTDPASAHEPRVSFTGIRLRG